MAPATKVTCLGVDIDTEEFTISITPEKIQEILKICEEWANKTVASKRQFQSLLGKLLYVTKCVKSSGFFLNRMLELLRAAHKHDKINLSVEFHKDLNWFRKFMPNFNGVAFFSHMNIKHEIKLDACLQGLGAKWGDQVYAIPLPLGYENMSITHLEMLNIMVALRTWARCWAGHLIRIHCDNQAVVNILNRGRTRDLTLAAIARNIFMDTATHDICLKVAHIAGYKNQIADSLSRWYMGIAHQQRVKNLLPSPQWATVAYNALVIDWSI